MESICDKPTPMDRSLRAFDVALQKIELEMLVVLSGKHHEVEFRSVGLKRRRDQMKSEALHDMKTRTQSIDTLLEYEQQGIANDFQVALDKAKDKIALEIAEKIRLVELCRDGEKDSRVSTRSLRSKKKSDEKEPEDNQPDNDLTNGSLSSFLAPINLPVAASIGPQVISNGTLNPLFRQRGSLRRAVSPASLVLEKQLQNEEIIEDIYEINRDDQLYSIQDDPKEERIKPKVAASSRSKRIDKSTQKKEIKDEDPGIVSVDIRLGEVRTGGVVYYKGDSVIVNFTDAHKKKQQLVGNITSVNNSEVHLRVHADGSKHRIYLSHLRNGRSYLSHI